jgi:hypothetical protein
MSSLRLGGTKVYEEFSEVSLQPYVLAYLSSSLIYEKEFL